MNVNEGFLLKISTVLKKSPKQVSVTDLLESSQLEQLLASLEEKKKSFL